VKLFLSSLLGTNKYYVHETISLLAKQYDYISADEKYGFF
jgi:hypothetical protein